MYAFRNGEHKINAFIILMHIYMNAISNDLHRLYALRVDQKTWANKTNKIRENIILTHLHAYTAHTLYSVKRAKKLLICKHK